MKQMITALTAAAAGALLTIAVAGQAGAAEQPDPKKTYVVNCQGTLDYKPKQIVLACADAGVYVGNITWRKWTMNGASGTGTLFVNSCNPTCSAGNVETYKGVRLRLSGAASGPGLGTFVNTFTTLTGTFQGQGPVLTSSATWTLDNAIKE